MMHPDELEELEYQMFAQTDYLREAYGSSIVDDHDDDPTVGMWQCPRCFRWFNGEEKAAHESAPCAPPEPEPARIYSEDDVPF